MNIERIYCGDSTDPDTAEIVVSDQGTLEPGEYIIAGVTPSDYNMSTVILGASQFGIQVSCPGSMPPYISGGTLEKV